MDKSSQAVADGEAGKPSRPDVAHHQVLKQIGSGSYGEVWLAQNIMGAYRAIKVVRRSTFESERPFQREFEGLRHFEPISRTHDGLIDILEAGHNQTEGYFYYVMEAADDLADGQNISPNAYRPRTLANDLVPGKRLPFPRCLEIALALSESLGYLHRNGLVHRDIKPSNIIFVNGVPKLADIGLVTTSQRDATFIGAPGYIPPEGPGRPQGDVYALGKVLYEMMSGRDRLDFPHPPLDLEATEFEDFQELNSIVLKACERDPSRRYTSAVEMHDDLVLLQGGKSVRRLRRRERRLKAAVWVVGGVALLGLCGFAFQQVRAREMEARNRILRQGQLIAEAQLTRLSSRGPGWSQSALAKVAEAAQLSTKEGTRAVRDQAAAVLAGLDASMEPKFDNVLASFLSFDSTGNQLLIGEDGNSARLWDGTTLSEPIRNPNGLAPGFFDYGGLPVQLVYDPTERAFIFSEVSSQSELRRFAPGLEAEFSIARWSEQDLISLSSDGTLLAVICSNKFEFVLRAWGSNSSHSIALSGAPPSALCTDAAGRMVVVGDSAGELKAWRTEDWSSVSLPAANRNPIRSLALHRMNLTSELPHELTPGRWFLAAGDSGSGLRIWDLAAGVIKSQCHGSAFVVNALAFSSDGTLLAAGGDSPVALWDVVTGVPLLSLRNAYGNGAIAFSPRGDHLAVGVVGPYSPQGVQRWKLDYGRGVYTLRGMSATVAKFCFSPNGKYLAGLSHDWQVGIWETDSGQLVRIIEAPRGGSADNAGLAFSPDMDRLAFSAKGYVRLWDLASGQTTNLALTPGLVDGLCFANSKSLLHFQVEKRAKSTADSDHLGQIATNPVCVLRDLLAPEPNTAKWELRAFDDDVLDARFAAGGRYVIVAGRCKLRSTRKHIFKGIDCSSGKELWSIDSWRGGDSETITVDPTGLFVAIQLEDNGKSVMIDPASGTIKRTLPWLPLAMGPIGNPCAVQSPSEYRGCRVFGDKTDFPLLTLGIDSMEGDIFQFDRTGNLLAWGNPEGTVTLCNLAVIHRHLETIGLQW